MIAYHDFLLGIYAFGILSIAVLTLIGVYFEERGRGR